MVAAPQPEHLGDLVLQAQPHALQVDRQRAVPVLLRAGMPRRSRSVTLRLVVALTALEDMDQVAQEHVEYRPSGA